MVKSSDDFFEGQDVVVPWGINAQRHARVVEVWGRPARQVRVRLDALDDEGPATLLLNAKHIHPAA